MSLAVNTIPTPYIHVVVKRRKNAWYTVKDGNWSDPLTWESNAIRRWNYPGQNIPSPTFPQVGDDVYIGHNIVFDFAANQTIVVNNLYVAGSLTKATIFSYTLVVNGDCQATGTIDLSGASGTFVLKLFGVNNYINTFTSGTASTIYYSRNGDQPVMNLSYRNLQIGGIFTKTLTSNLTLTGNLVVDVSTILDTLIFELSTFNLTVNGTSTIGSLMKKSSSGSILFIGQLLLNNTSNKVIDFSGGNPTVEVRGGISSTNQIGVDSKFNAGTGQWTFSTNSQTIDCRGTSNLNFNCPILISGAITLTLDTTSFFSTQFVQFSNSVTGDNASSKLLNNRILYLNYNTTMPMATGIFDFTTSSTSVLGFVTSATFTIPYTTFQGLYISGGTKTLSGNTTLSTSLQINTAGNLECSTFNLQVGTTSTLAGYLSKSGSGTVTFIGLLTLSNTANSIDFSGGNPTVEVRGGITLISQTTTTFKSGTGQWTFSTNNQSINVTGTALSFNCTVLISGAITLTLSGSISTDDLTFLAAVNGDNASSTLDNRLGNLSTGVSYQAATMPMVTGVFTANAAVNIWRYNATGNQDVRGAAYSTVEFGGSGNKTLQGNCTDVSRSTTGSAVLVLNGFTITP